MFLVDCILCKLTKSRLHTEVTTLNVGFERHFGVFQVEIMLKDDETPDKVRLVRTELLFKFCFWFSILMILSVPDEGYSKKYLIN